MDSRKAFALILLVGIAGTGTAVRLVKVAGYDTLGSLIWLLGYGTTVLVLWWGWLRPLDLDGRTSPPSDEGETTDSDAGSTDATPPQDATGSE
jgi:hypothetical protein